MHLSMGAITEEVSITTKLNLINNKNSASPFVMGVNAICRGLVSYGLSLIALGIS